LWFSVGTAVGELAGFSRLKTCAVLTHFIYMFMLLSITVFTHVQAAPRFLGQEFGNNNLKMSCTGFYLCESKIFAIAFAALWLLLAAFAVICQ
jgi:hypothetical protein